MNTTTAEMTAVTAVTTPDMTVAQMRRRGLLMREFEQKAFLTALPTFIGMGIYTRVQCVNMAWDTAFESLGRLIVK